MDSKESEWFEDWFDTTYYHLLYQNRDEIEAKRFVHALIHHLDLKPQSHILDIACGKGRHSFVMAELGYKVCGIDLSKNNIKLALAEADGDNPTFYQHDVRQPMSFDKFDAFVNLFTSFGYMAQTTDNILVLKNMKNSLKPGGKWVIDFLNVHKAIKELVPKETKVIQGIEFTITKKYEEGCIVKNIHIQDGKNELNHSEIVRAFTLDDFKQMLPEAGLNLTETFGDFSLNNFDPTNSPRLILSGTTL